MSRLSILLTFFLAVLFFSCIPEEITEGSPEMDGFSNANQLRFNDTEFAALSQSLSIAQDIELASVTLPQHLNPFGSEEALTQTSSEARKALLGRVLFYDKQLSATGETSCATCHKQEIAFSDDLAFSEGINGAVTKRNSIALGSVPSFAPSISGYGSTGDNFRTSVDGEVKFFWDERANTIKEQSELTIADELEMGRNIHNLSDELKNQEIYQILTMKAFGTTDLTPDRITLALERFTSSIVSLDTPFDELANELFLGLPASTATQSERRGMQIFGQNCASCHGSQMSKPSVFVANNGLEEVYTDKGIGDRTGAFRDDGVFKVPFLRNVALTAPYMHDGRFATLREVIDHYSEGIANHPNLHRNLRTNFQGEAIKMNFSEQDKIDLIRFLEMTTDQSVLVAERFSDPFRP